MKPAKLTKDTESFSAWKLQVNAFLALKLEEKEDLSVPMQINMIILAVDSDLLHGIQIDGRTTVNSILETIEKVWLRSRRPSNPTVSFYEVQCNGNIRECWNSLQRFGVYFNASDSVIRQRFMEILPESVATIAHLEVARRPEITSADLVNLVENIPLPKSIVASVPSRSSCRYCKSTEHEIQKCPKLKCYSCGQYGHKKAQCQKNNSKN